LIQAVLSAGGGENAGGAAPARGGSQEGK
jgi:hypothetical protein